MQSILLVDDLPDLIDEEIKLLKEVNLDYDIHIATTGDRAIEILQNNQINLVILDLMLPKKGGLELLHEIKRKFNLPIIIYSAYLEKIPREQLLHEGADYILSKPAPLDLFVNTIRYCIEPDKETTLILVHGYKIKEIKNQVLAVIIQKALKKAQNITAAAELLGISRECLSHTMKRLGIVC